ncbi:hypothetical protein F4778DRAFT_740909 [Xylariomycetidae sp. FL2044]|nr:hypothetical protein F4778DRAFT_740909 [Xylariomycetidae sp. FL2044]
MVMGHDDERDGVAWLLTWLFSLFLFTCIIVSLLVCSCALGRLGGSLILIMSGLIIFLHTPQESLVILKSS